MITRRCLLQATVAPGGLIDSLVPWFDVGTRLQGFFGAYFVLTLFTGSALLFLVQPMVAKMLLPRLGGTPDVWNTARVFFQAMLLAGYAFAHNDITDRLAAVLYAPSRSAADTLAREGVPGETVLIGDVMLDAFRYLHHRWPRLRLPSARVG